MLRGQKNIKLQNNYFARISRPGPARPPYAPVRQAVQHFKLRGAHQVRLVTAVFYMMGD
jgi:hypothetical protein